VHKNGSVFQLCELRDSNNLYSAQNKTDDCVKYEQISNKMLPADFTCIEGCQNGRTSAMVKQEYFEAVKLRKKNETVGNFESSRTHLLSTIVLTIPGKFEKYNIYMLDLAGKETQTPSKSSDSIKQQTKNAIANQLTKGINLSLNYLIELIGKKKTLGSIPLDVGSNSKTVSSIANPLETLMAPMWMEPSSKVMVLACGYPFASESKEPFNTDAYLGNVENDGWKKYFELKEDSTDKLDRDCKVYEALSKVQRLKNFEPE
jgi:hypothetical protein